MSETSISTQSQAGKHWLNLTLRILMAILLVFVVVSFLVDIAGIVGVWVARAPARTGVINVTATVTHALTRVDDGLTHVNTVVQNGRQTLAQVNAEAANLGNGAQANNPMLTRLSTLVDNTLAPRVDNASTITSDIHDALITANSAAMVLSSIPGVSMPMLSDRLGSMSMCAQLAQAAVQDLRLTLANIKASLVMKAQTAITQLTSKIDARLSEIQALVKQYQARVEQAITQISTRSNNLLLLLDVLVVSLTLLFLIFAAGLVLLISFCWQFIRTGYIHTLRKE
jgi:hypothetical protein